MVSIFCIGSVSRFLLAHHEAEGRRGLRQRVEHEAVGLLERDLEGLLVLGRDVLHALHHVLAGAVARRPAADRGDAVSGGHRRAV